MRIDPEFLKFVSKDDIRVLIALEMGMKNHEWISIPLIESLSKVGRGKTYTIIQRMAKFNLLNHNSKNYDGYNLRKRGYDYLALWSMCKKHPGLQLGSQMGCGKESDIHLAIVQEDSCSSMLEVVIKFTRLGRTSFRQVKNKRDYTTGKADFSNWLYLSRLSAEREYSYLEILFNNGFPVPTPVGQSRHCIIMHRIGGGNLHSILYHLDKQDALTILRQTLAIIKKLRNACLVHGDLNEYNILIEFPPNEKYAHTFTGKTVTANDFYEYRKQLKRYNTRNREKIGFVEVDCNAPRVWLIDFPQMISIYHDKAESYYLRDVQGIVSYLCKRFDINSEIQLDPIFEDISTFDVKDVKVNTDLDNKVSGEDDCIRLDVEVKAYGYGGAEKFEWIDHDLGDLGEQNDDLEEENSEEYEYQVEEFTDNKHIENSKDTNTPITGTDPNSTVIGVQSCGVKADASRQAIDLNPSTIPKVNDCSSTDAKVEADELTVKEYNDTLEELDLNGPTVRSRSPSQSKGPLDMDVDVDTDVDVEVDLQDGLEWQQKYESYKKDKKCKLATADKVSIYRGVTESVKSISHEIDYFAIRDNIRKQNNNTKDKANYKDYNRQNRRKNKKNGEQLKQGVDW